MDAPIVSLCNFLQTGQLWKLSTELRPKDVGQLLGPPTSWIIGEELPFPEYWCYGPLEIRFKPDKNHPSGVVMDFFQLERLNGVLGERLIVPSGHALPAFVVDLNGVNGSSDITSIINAVGAQFIHCVDVHPALGNVSLLTRSVDVLMSFSTDEDDEESILADDTRLVEIAAKRSRLDSIYKFRNLNRAHPVPAPWRRFLAEDFLSRTHNRRG
jgi:hypothetical protein